MAHRKHGAWWICLLVACGPKPADPADDTTTTTTGPDPTTRSSTTAASPTSSSPDATTTAPSTSTSSTAPVDPTTSTTSTDSTTITDVTTSTSSSSGGSSSDEGPPPCTEEKFVLMPDPPDSCVLPLELEPANPTIVEVTIGDVQIPRIDDCASENGWIYVNPMFPHDAILLCGQACVDLQLAGAATVEYFCFE